MAGLTLVSAPASAAVTELGGALDDVLDNAVGAGNSAMLVEDTQTYWPETVSGSDVDLNGFELNIDTGGGNAQEYRGAISGPGTLRLRGRSDASWFPDVRLAGSGSNTPDSVTIVRGRVTLNKSFGADALAGQISAEVPADEIARIHFESSDQLSDDSVVDSSLSLGDFHIQLEGFSDTVAGLVLLDGHTVNTGAGGVLTVGDLTVDETALGSGVYTAQNSSFVVGTGSVVVPGGPANTVDVPDDYSNPNVTEDLGEGDSSTNYNLLGNAAFGAQTGTLSGEITISGSGSVLTLESADDPIFLAGALSGNGGLTANGGSGQIWLAGGSNNALFGTHTVSKGTLVVAKASGMTAIDADEIVVGGGDAPATLRWAASNQVWDTARFTLQGPELAVLDFDGHSDTLGSMVLSGDAEVHLGEESAVVNFDNSTSETWAPGAELIIREWDGDVDGGGDDQVLFGFFDDTLTPVQLGQISFVDPVGFPPGTYPALHLGSGELVPDGIPLDFVDIPDGASFDNITESLGDGDPSTNYNLLGDAEIGWQTGTQNGYFQIPDSFQTLTVDTGGGNTTALNGDLRGAGNLIWIGGGASEFWQTNASFLGGTEPNTLSGTHTLVRGTLALAKPGGVTAIAGDIVVGGGDNQAILRWDGSDQVADTSSVTMTGPNPSILRMDGHLETLGRLILESDGELVLGEDSAVVRFGDSSAESWTSGSEFVIREWSGAPEGGGGEAVFFGDSPAGLSSGQLGQIRFIDPAGFPEGLYGAEILADGEVVPAELALTPFESWADSKGLSGEDAVFDADPDGDGVPNGIEFVIGGEPNPAVPGSNSQSLLPTGQAFFDDFIFTHTLMNDAAELEPVVEFSETLATDDWTTAVDGDNADIEVTPGALAATVRVTIPNAPGGRMFVRLKVSQP